MGDINVVVNSTFSRIDWHNILDVRLLVLDYSEPVVARYAHSLILKRFLAFCQMKFNMSVLHVWRHPYHVV